MLNPDAPPFESKSVFQSTNSRLLFPLPHLFSFNYTRFPVMQIPAQLGYRNFCWPPLFPLKSPNSYSPKPNDTDTTNLFDPLQNPPLGLQNMVIPNASETLKSRRATMGSGITVKSGRFCEGSYQEKRGPVWRRKLEAPSQNLEFTESELAGKTTIMIKNIPNRYREMLLDLLDKHCVDENKRVKSGTDVTLSEYDFVYMPMDFKNKCNLGYAFVNFTTATALLRLYKSLHNHGWEVFNTKKICQICYARIQGKNALVEHFQKSHFRCDTDDYLPVLLNPPRNGLGRSVSTLVGRRRVSNSE